MVPFLGIDIDHVDDARFEAVAVEIGRHRRGEDESLDRPRAREGLRDPAHQPLVAEISDTHRIAALEGAETLDAPEQRIDRQAHHAGTHLLQLGEMPLARGIIAETAEVHAMPRR